MVEGKEGKKWMLESMWAGEINCLQNSFMEEGKYVYQSYLSCIEIPADFIQATEISKEVLILFCCTVVHIGWLGRTSPALCLIYTPVVSVIFIVNIFLKKNSLLQENFCSTSKKKHHATDAMQVRMFLQSCQSKGSYISTAELLQAKSKLI